tara:strand:+ start:113 stop:514 length:402 start_codon:yes stop_codon:yes gene_type:complete
MKKFILAIDFDGTVAEDSFPEVGALIKDADTIIRKLKQDGHDIIINTCRTGKYEGLAEYFLIKNKIPFDYINSNLPRVIDFYKQDCRKVSADYYIDNRNIGGLPSWKEIYEIISADAKSGVETTMDIANKEIK